MTHSTRTRPLTLLAGALAVLLTATGLSLVAAAPATAAEKGTVRGQVIAAGKVSLKVRWFDSEWKQLGSRKVAGDVYSLALEPGTYYLQFVDTSPSYDVDKYAPTDKLVVVRAGKTVQRNVRMQTGAAITGKVRTGSKAGRRARVVAANKQEQSFETTADKKGRFALGGLPAGDYSVFTYDSRKKYVDKSLWVPKLRSGDKEDVRIRLKKKAGSLLVDLEAGGATMTRSVFVTAVSKKTGQFWTVRARKGVASFQGLYPGGYRMVAPGVGNYLPRTAAIKGAKVPGKGRADLASSFSWTRQGGQLTALVVTGDDARDPVANASVQLFAASGERIARTTTDEDGRFLLGEQLGTQSDLTLVVSNDFSEDFEPYTASGLAVTVNTVDDLGVIEIPRAEEGTRRR